MSRNAEVKKKLCIVNALPQIDHDSFNVFVYSFFYFL